MGTQQVLLQHNIPESIINYFPQENTYIPTSLEESTNKQTFKNLTFWGKNTLIYVLKLIQ